MKSKGLSSCSPPQTILGHIGLFILNEMIQNSYYVLIRLTFLPR